MDQVPIYRIDLSRPPAQRYRELVQDFRHKIPHLSDLFKDVVAGFGLPPRATTRVAKRLLRRLYSKEQTEEIRGISEASGLDIYLLVCLNTLLDLFMGCTSGGARAKMHVGRAPGGTQTRMLHFRTLDWAMDPLREIVVQLNFVADPDGPVIARSITYVGFVGALTAVRPGLSMSLNFRPYHNDSHSRVSNLRFQYHRLLVLLGRRPSISSTLRSMLLPPSSYSHRHFDTLASIQRRLPALPSTAAYLTFSNGDQTLVMEKDRVSAHTSTSSSFIAVTNHDASCDENPGSMSRSDNAKLAVTGMREMVEESQGRKACIESKWRKAEAAFKRRRRKNAGSGDSDSFTCVTESQLIKWVEAWPITNESTHYATIMDPLAGDFVYLKRYLEPVSE